MNNIQHQNSLQHHNSWGYERRQADTTPYDYDYDYYYIPFEEDNERWLRTTTTSTFQCNGGGDIMKRQWTMKKNCVQDCDRTYYLYLPSSVTCSKNNNAVVVGNDSSTGGGGRLPLVFAVHCLGCSPQTMMYWVDIAEKYQFVLAIPEGLQNSFNAQHCCGHALDNNVDDVGLLKAMIQELTVDVLPNVLSTNLTYAWGWSNGGYMVSYASHLFRGIAPISGYQVDLFNFEDHERKPIAIFLHHSQDDPFVRITGCCSNASMPHCCCGISDTSGDTCTSVQTKMQEWASDSINGCHGEPLVIRDEPDVVTCYTYPNCLANTTYCVHQHKGHFNRPSLEKVFPMSDEIAEFFARDACQANGHGQWIERGGDGPSRCICEHKASGQYCTSLGTTSPLSNNNDALFGVKEEEENRTTIPPEWVLVVFFLIAFIFVCVPFGLLAPKCYNYMRRRPRKSSDSQQSYSKVSTVELRSL